MTCQGPQKNIPGKKMNDLLTIGSIAVVTGGRLLGEGSRTVRHLATDSRSLPGTQDVMFLAIRGNNHDGNDYLEEVYERGVRCFLTDHDPDLQGMEEASFCVVKDVMKALHTLAAKRRQAFTGHLLAITGSNGKTIVKEWLWQMLRQETGVIRSPRSYNSQLGVPLSLWQLSGKYETAIIEAGISMPGEMDRLEQIIGPDTGILTNIGTAHSENFSSDTQKLREKLQLFRRCKTLVYRADLHVEGRPVGACLSDLPVKKAGWLLKGGTNGFRVSGKSRDTNPAGHDGQTSHGAAKGDAPDSLRESDRDDRTGEAAEMSLTGDVLYRYRVTARTGEAVQVSLDHGGRENRFTLPFTDDASVENILHVVTFCLEFGISAERIRVLLGGLEPVEMRLQTLKGIHGTTLVNDVYNSDLAGLRVALDVLMQQGSHNEKAVILSDLFQSGMEDEDLYAEVARLLAFRKADRVIGIGPAISGQHSQFPAGSRFFKDTSTFLQEFDPRELENAAVLIKGARKFRFEDITDRLQLQVHKTVLEINVTEMVRNLNYFRSLVKPSTKIMVMVKALSYGAGSYEIAEFLQHEKIDYLAVAFPDEGIRLRRAGVKLPVMVMNTDAADYGKVLSYGLEPEIFSREGLLEFVSVCRYMGVSDQPVHIKLDTGMHRLGFVKEELAWLAGTLAEGEVKVRSLFTHLAGSGDPALDEFTHRQLASFREMAAYIGESTVETPMLHALNSAGIERFPEYQMDMVRIGIGLYGQGVKRQLDPVSTFRTVISQVRELQPGETVGYGRSGKVDRPSRIATIPVGYADGINRHLGNGQFSFLVNGTMVPTIGNICMDMTMLDVTGTEAAPGDTVELFGKNCSVSRMAEQLDTIVYEILTSIPERVKRVYIRE